MLNEKKSLNYLEERGISENFYPEKGIMPNWVREIIFKNKPKKILDFGCGYGQVMFGVKNYFPEICVIGYEIDQNSIKFCQKNGLSLINDFSDLKSNSIDMVFMFHVLEHIEEDNLNFILCEIKRVLKTGGKILIAVPNAQSLSGVYWMYEDHTHKRLYTANSILRLIRANNFKYPKLIDKYAITGSVLPVKIIRLIFLKTFEFFLKIIFKVSANSFHVGENVFTYEIKVMGTK